MNKESSKLGRGSEGETPNPNTVRKTGGPEKGRKIARGLVRKAES